MAEIQRLKKGEKIDEKWIGELADSVNLHEKLIKDINPYPVPIPEDAEPKIWASVTGYTKLSGWKWEYSFTTYRWEKSGKLYVVKTEPWTGIAYNDVEESGLCYWPVPVGTVVKLNKVIHEDGTASYHFNHSNDLCRWGKITAIASDANCQNTITVRPCDVNGNYLYGAGVTVSLVLLSATNKCSKVAGICVQVGDIVPYLPVAENYGLYLNWYKRTGVRYSCEPSEITPDLTTLGFFETDFELFNSSPADCVIPGIVDVRWRGMLVGGYPIGVDGVKEIIFDDDGNPGEGETVPVFFQTSSTTKFRGPNNCDPYTSVTVEGYAWVDDLPKLTVTDCVDNATADVTDIKFSEGFNVTDNGGGQAQVDLALTAGEGVSIDPGTGACELVINLAPCNLSGPNTLGDDTEGSETEDATTWALGDGPLELWVQTRTVYDDAGDQKLYGFKRKLTFDACGKLNAVTGETRFEVDAPEDCP